MEFNKVEVENELDSLAEDELRELVTQYQEAQLANETEFEEVTDTVAEFKEYDDELTEEVLEHSSLSESAASSLPFSEKRSLLSDLEDEESVEDGEDGEFDEEDGEDGADFEDRGTRGETHGEDGTPDFVEDALGGVAGVSL